MHFSETPHRLGFERAAALLQVQAGCTWGRCRYCAVCVRHPGAVRVSSLEEVAADLRELAGHWRAYDRVFLYGPNPFGMPVQALEERLELVRRELPSVRTIGGFACVGDILRLTDAQLDRWAQLGVDGLSIGAESGWEPALKLMRKPQTPEQIAAACARLDAAGITYTLFYLAGMAGAGAGAQNAAASAALFNAINPYRINVMTMTVFDGTPLARMVEAGEFVPAGEREIFLEMRDFIAGLTDCTSLIDTGHDVNFVNFDGVLPRDREGMVALLELRAKHAREELLTDYRAKMRPF
jgi:radical SAM superfamily enzyme YgiQ (UPF0313 family)